MNLIIKFECPGCGQGFDGDASSEFEKFTCPTCKNEFYPEVRKIVAPPESPASIALDALKVQPAVEKQLSKADQAETNLQNRRAVIHNKAFDAEAVAMLLLVVGCLAALISIAVAVSGNSAFWGWTITSSALGSAMWFYLVAQIIHIRANTEK